MPITHVFAGIPTRDFPAAVAWYERFLGRPPDRFPHSTEAVWQLADHALIYVVSDPTRAGSALITLIVDDLDGWVSRLTDLGLPLGEEERVAAGVRRVALVDRDRNSISLGQVGP